MCMCYIFLFSMCVIWGTMLIKGSKKCQTLFIINAFYWNDLSFGGIAGRRDRTCLNPQLARRRLVSSPCFLWLTRSRATGATLFLSGVCCGFRRGGPVFATSGCQFPGTAHFPGRVRRQATQITDQHAQAAWQRAWPSRSDLTSQLTSAVVIHATVVRFN